MTYFFAVFVFYNCKNNVTKIRTLLMIEQKCNGTKSGQLKIKFGKRGLSQPVWLYC